MALASTTLAAACAVGDNTITVASATSVAVGRLIRIDNEVMQVTKGYVAASVTVPVTRGQDGTVTAAHVNASPVTHGDAGDFASPVPGADDSVTYPSRPGRDIASYSASGAIALPAAGRDMVAQLLGTSTLTMTLANPTKDMDTTLLYLVSNGKAAHTVTYTAGVGNGGSTMDVGTFNTTEATGCILMALNGFWVLIANGIGSAGTQVAGVVWA